MTSQIAKDFAKQMMNSDFDQFMFETPVGLTSVSSDAFSKKSGDSHPEEPNSDSSIASGFSQYSNDVERWLRGSPTESTGVQNSRVIVVQRSTLAPSTSLATNGMWYLMAMALPLFSNTMQWRCTPSNVLNAAEQFFGHLSQYCEVARVQVRRLAQDHVARDLFATAMDIVLVVYAIGFLVLSLYQASIIG
ncbi:uncharacterized protein LOC110382972 [Helicoverpa armigera]|uniref:uncharacterized protein LOC110382972 n=1 Tax=Helicoverpa armigera TaxID=29058 RepID=UPI002112B624|nr:uncharacterized protein LOC110382972 [Helicoverpa armigera]XP_049692913.1 uncharacterized protein LOC110382972 [Helicoverpa armigera]